MNAERCPFCGLVGQTNRNGTHRHNGCSPADLSPPRALALDPSFDRVMNWVVGLLLAAVISAVVVFQTHPPY
jgi:hypothetical protein